MPIDLAGKPPILLYKDGSSDPSRNPQHMVGAVLFVPGSIPLFTYSDVPVRIVNNWLPSKNHIHLVELFAGPMALDTFAPQLQGQPIIHMVDNSAALGSFAKGYSNNCDAIRIVFFFGLG